ncbi:MAG: phage holin family protein [Allosphingosinicella sp.]|uniref:phage holin family protein n=1 Tax=Allosphingosinicella sp. TaxID=2823234 RepID=UPI003929EA98
MDARTQLPPDESIGDLIGQLIEDGRTYARAEVNLYKQIAAYRASKAKNGIAALGAAAVLGLSALTAITVGLVMGLAVIIGPVAAGIAVAAAYGIVAFVLLRWGLGKMSALGGDEDERKALEDGEIAR